jgi:hypothetical protein
MKSTFTFLVVATLRLVKSSPINNGQASQMIVEDAPPVIEAPTNFYIEKDLDRKVSWTPNGTVTTVRYG